MNKMIFWIFFCLIFIGFIQNLEARNVSYVGGWTYLQDFSEDKTASLLHYTIHPNFSLGYRYAYHLEDEWHYHGPQLNYLVKRWNQEDAQANIYAHGSIGHAYSDAKGLDKVNDLGFISGASADWENRRWFTSYGIHYMNLGVIDHFLEQKARIGVAPYIAEYGQIHTWVMGELKYSDDRANKWTITPLVRVFKSGYMVEVGWTIGEGPLVNLRILF